MGKRSYTDWSEPLGAAREWLLGLSTEDSSVLPLPSIRAFLLVDSVYQDSVTRKKILVGLFNEFTCPTFPFSALPFAIFMQFTDVRAEYQLRMRFVSLKDQSVIAETPPFALPKPAADKRISDIVLNLGGLPLPEPGKYAFELYAGDGELMKDFPVNVTPRQHPGASNDAGS